MLGFSAAQGIHPRGAQSPDQALSLLPIQQEGMYFQRIRFDLSELVVGTGNNSVLERAIAEVGSVGMPPSQVGGCPALACAQLTLEMALPGGGPVWHGVEPVLRQEH